MAVDYKVLRVPSEEIVELPDFQAWLNIQGADGWDISYISPNRVITFVKGAGGATKASELTIENVSNTPSGASFYAIYDWKGKDIMLNLTSLSADSPIIFDSADGWTDGDWTNIWIASPNGSGFGIVYTGAGTLSAYNDEGRIKQTNGASSVKIDGTTARVIGKLKKM